MNAKRNRPADDPGGSEVIAATNTSKAPHHDIPGLTRDQSQVLHNWIADANGVVPERLAYVAVVEIAEGKYRRRTYLTLAAAQRAIERAEGRGVEARVYLAELRPVGDLG